MTPPHGSDAPYCSYTLGKKIASGGMAEVFEARALNRAFETPIVVKRMLPQFANDKSFVTMFIDEARLCRRLDHPNIVKVYDFEATDKGLGLVMELIDGPNLMTVLKAVASEKQCIPVELAVFVTCHVLDALDYAHTLTRNQKPLDVVHRDVSPSNILFTRKGHVKLADFGIARASERQHETAGGTLKGKYAYMSPEQISGANIDARSDVFSTGIVLAEMLMGRRLFTGASDLDLLLKVRKADLSRFDELADHVPVEIDAIVRKALVTQAAQRFQSAAAMRDALLAWLASSKRRTGSAGLAKYLARFIQPGNQRQQTSSAVLSGTQTRMARSELRRAAQAGREVFALGASTAPPAVPKAALLEDHSLGSFDTAIAHNQNTPTRAGDWLQIGTLDRVHPIEILCEIYRQERTGLLVLKSGDQIKELYFIDGHPEFVRSNVHSDRFGQFLVSKGVISQAQLHRVLAALPHFEGRMGRSLVGLQILSPVDAVRLLSEQITHKIVDACGWTEGSFSFRDEIKNQWPAESLQLETMTIVAQALGTLPKSLLVQWQGRHQRDRLLADTGKIAALGFGGRTAKLMRLFTGQRTLEEILQALPAALDQHRFLAVSYVLTRCQAITYVAGQASVGPAIIESNKAKHRDVHVARTVINERRKRRFPRAQTCHPGTVESRGRNPGKANITVCSVTCDGLGLRFENEPLELKRGDALRVHFHTGTEDLMVQGKVAWCTKDRDEDIHVGVTLQHALVPAAMRESFTAWAGSLLLGSRP